MSQPPQPPYSGQPYGQPTSGQPYQGQPPYPGQPYSGQPYPGQPNPDVPTSVPPGYPPTSPYQTPEYGQPQYAQPQYGQPQYGQQGYEQPQYGQPDYAQQGYGQPGFPPPTPPKKSRALPIVLISIAVVLVLCVGGSIALFMFAKNKVNETTSQVNGTTTGTPTDAQSPNGSASAKPAATVKISEPKTLGGRPKLTDAQFSGVASELQSSLKAVPGSTNSVGALYGTVSKRDIVIVAAAEAPIENPTEELTQTFYGAGIGGLKIENITAASTGALGGTAKCGSATTQSVDMAICSWADNGSLGMMIWYSKSVSKAKAEFPKLRAQIEKKA